MIDAVVFVLLEEEEMPTRTMLPRSSLDYASSISRYSLVLEVDGNNCQGPMHLVLARVIVLLPIIKQGYTETAAIEKSSRLDERVQE